MKLLDYLAAQPNEATTLLLETPGYSYPGFICGLKSSLGDDIRNIDERRLRDLRDPKLHKAYDFYLSCAVVSQQRIAAYRSAPGRSCAPPRGRKLSARYSGNPSSASESYGG